MTMHISFNKKPLLGQIAFAFLALLGTTVAAQDTKAGATPLWQFWADAKVQSFRPGDTLASYHWSPSGGVGPGGTLTLGAGDHVRHFDVRIVAQLKSQRFVANVSVKPNPNDTRTKAQAVEYDLSDLTPRTLEIARDDDGRVHQLSLIPTMREIPQPKQFKAADLHLDYWSFPSSPIILNDQDYIGRFSMGRSPVAFCDIPGVAKVEFSLLRLKDASPLGTLEKGVINIKHDSGASLRISDVKNGNNQDVLSGGPYRVWVRWLKPSESTEQYRESLKRQISSLKERIQNGDLTLPPGRLEQLEQMSQTGRISLTEMGVRGIEEGELVERQE